MYLKSPKAGKKKSLKEDPYGQKKMPGISRRAEKMKLKRELQELQEQPKFYVPVEAPWKRRNTEIPSKQINMNDPALETPVDPVPLEVLQERAKSVAILYPKGPYMAITGPDLLRDLGRKTSQLKD